MTVNAEESTDGRARNEFGEVLPTVDEVVATVIKEMSEDGKMISYYQGDVINKDAALFMLALQIHENGSGANDKLRRRLSTIRDFVVERYKQNQEVFSDRGNNLEKRLEAKGARDACAEILDKF